MTFVALAVTVHLICKLDYWTHKPNANVLCIYHLHTMKYTRQDDNYSDVLPLATEGYPTP